MPVMTLQRSRRVGAAQKGVDTDLTETEDEAPGDCAALPPCFATLPFWLFATFYCLFVFPPSPSPLTVVFDDVLHQPFLVAVVVVDVVAVCCNTGQPSLRPDCILPRPLSSSVQAHFSFLDFLDFLLAYSLTPNQFSYFFVE